MRSSFLSFSKVKLLCYQSTKKKLINCLIHREMAKMAVFGGWDGSATVFHSSTLFIPMTLIILQENLDFSYEGHPPTPPS